MVERRVRHALFVALALFLAACGAAGATSTDSSAQDSPPDRAAGAGTGSGTGAGSGQQRLETVAEVVEILNAESYVDDRTASSGQFIARDAELSTDDTGSFTFAFRWAHTECVLVSGSAALVVSRDRLLLRQVAGETVCEVDSPDDPVLFDSNGRLLRGERGTYRLTANERGGGAAVLDGSAQAVDPDTGETVAMGPQDSTGWDNTGDLDAGLEPGPVTDEVDEGVRALREDSAGGGSGDSSSTSGSDGTDDGGGTDESTGGNPSADQSTGNDPAGGATGDEDEEAATKEGVASDDEEVNAGSPDAAGGEDQRAGRDGVGADAGVERDGAAEGGAAARLAQ